MKKISKILVPTDFSPCAANAFRYAVKLAEKFEASVEVLHVIYPEYDYGMDFPVITAPVTKERLAVARERLQLFIRGGMEEAGVKKETVATSFSATVGAPVTGISLACKENETDLIIMGTKGEHNRFERWVGTVASGVVQQASCHVMIIPEFARVEDLHRIVYATDLHETDPYHIWQVASLLQPFSPEMHCVHVYSGGNGAEIPSEDLVRFFRENAPTVKLHFHRIDGTDLSSTLNDFCDKEGADLVVMYKPSRHFLMTLVHRSATRDMAIQSQLPLLVIK